jgi:DnaJ-class molecular chaperone
MTALTPCRAQARLHDYLTFHCELPRGHAGDHLQEFWVDGQLARLSWQGDGRARQGRALRVDIQYRCGACQGRGSDVAGRVCPACDGEGIDQEQPVAELARCPSCHGRGCNEDDSDYCEACLGSGWWLCTVCQGRGYTGPLVDANEPCARCAGTGVEPSTSTGDEHGQG